MTFSFSRGLMVDWSLAGGGVRFDAKKNAEVYGKEVTPAEVLSGSVPVPPEFDPVVQKLNQARHGGRKEGRKQARGGGVGCCPRAATTQRLLVAERAGLCAAAAGGRHQAPLACHGARGGSVRTPSPASWRPAAAACAGQCRAAAAARPLPRV